MESLLSRDLNLLEHYVNSLLSRDFWVITKIIFNKNTLKNNTLNKHIIC